MERRGGGCSQGGLGCSGSFRLRCREAPWSIDGGEATPLLFTVGWGWLATTRPRKDKTNRYTVVNRVILCCSGHSMRCCGARPGSWPAAHAPVERSSRRCGRRTVRPSLRRPVDCWWRGLWQGVGALIRELHTPDTSHGTLAAGEAAGNAWRERMWVNAREQGEQLNEPRASSFAERHRGQGDSFSRPPQPQLPS